MCILMYRKPSVIIQRETTIFFLNSVKNVTKNHANVSKLMSSGTFVFCLNFLNKVSITVMQLFPIQQTLLPHFCSNSLRLSLERTEKRGTTGSKGNKRFNLVVNNGHVYNTFFWTWNYVSGKCTRRIMHLQWTIWVERSLNPKRTVFVNQRSTWLLTKNWLMSLHSILVIRPRQGPFSRQLFVYR